MVRNHEKRYLLLCRTVYRCLVSPVWHLSKSLLPCRLSKLLIIQLRSRRLSPGVPGLSFSTMAPRVSQLVLCVFTMMSSALSKNVLFLFCDDSGRMCNVYVRVELQMRLTRSLLVVDGRVDRPRPGSGYMETSLSRAVYHIGGTCLPFVV